MDNLPITLKEEGELDRLLSANDNFLIVVSFIAPWSENCVTTSDLTRVLANDPEWKQVVFAELDAEELPALSQKYDVNSVPTIIFIRDKQEVGRLVGADVRNYAARVAALAVEGPSVEGVPVKTVPKSAAEIANEAESLPDKLRRLINQHSVMVFMKGNPAQPKCGFSRQVIDILNGTGVSYKTFDILEDEEVRQGLKDFSQWQTYPQIYVKGVLAGGLDVIRDMREMGNLQDVLTGKEAI